MLIRPSIAASEQTERQRRHERSLFQSGIMDAGNRGIDQLRTEINGWFAEVATTIEFVPRAGVLGLSGQARNIRDSAADQTTFPHSFKERPDYVLGAPIQITNNYLAPLLEKSTETEIVVQENNPFITADGIWLLLFLDRSLAKEAEQQTTGDQIFSKKGSSQSKTQ